MPKKRMLKIFSAEKENFVFFFKEKNIFLFPSFSLLPHFSYLSLPTNSMADDDSDGLREKGTVCVTGATGFIASHIIHLLLSNGYNVNGTVRNKNKCEGLVEEYMKKLPKGCHSRLQLFEADLMQDGSFDESVQGCVGIVHAAAAVKLTADDPMNEIIKPSKIGITNVFNSALKATSTLKSFIFTSSIAAIINQQEGEKIFSEKDWNRHSTPSKDPYSYAKTQAEQTALELMQQHPSSFSFYSLNPSMVLGPVHLLSRPITSSAGIPVRMLSGEMPMAPQLSFGCVDVRDLAVAHLILLEKGIDEQREREKGRGIEEKQDDREGRDDEKENVAKEKEKERKGEEKEYPIDGHAHRYLISNEAFSMLQLAESLRRGLGGKKCPYPLPTSTLPNLFMYLAVPFTKELSFSFLWENLGKTHRLDNSKSKSVGVSYRPLDETMYDMALSYIEAGVIPDKRESIEE